MIIEFSKNLKEQNIYANGDELASVMGRDRDAKGQKVYSYPKEERVLAVKMNDPVLVTDVYRIAEFPPTLRDTIFKLYESPIKTTVYDGVSLDFEQRRFLGVWGPSIDTLLFTQALGTIDLSHIRSVIEIGAGSGFISKYLLEKFPAIEKVTLVDINPYALTCWQENISDSRAEFVIGDGVEYLANAKTDLIICNPPYIPRPHSLEDNPYEGTNLLSHLIRSTKDVIAPGGMFITNLSSLSEGSMRKVIVGEDRLRTEDVVSLRVPLKVCNVLNNPEWIEFLHDHGLEQRFERGYEYWHTITIVALHLIQ